jgi:hypothetical protein
MTTCLVCKWCEPIAGGNGEQGACRFGPPTAAMIMTPQGPANVTMWPTVRMTHDWCSHHVVQLVKPVSGFTPREGAAGDPKEN